MICYEFRFLGLQHRLALWKWGPGICILTSAYMFHSPSLRILVCVIKFAIQASRANDIMAET